MAQRGGTGVRPESLTNQLRSLAKRKSRRDTQRRVLDPVRWWTLITTLHQPIDLLPCCGVLRSSHRWLQRRRQRRSTNRVASCSWTPRACRSRCRVRCGSSGSSTTSSRLRGVEISRKSTSTSAAVSQSTGIIACVDGIAASFDDIDVGDWSLVWWTQVLHYSALHAAAALENGEVTKVLVQAGADVNAMTQVCVEYFKAIS